MGRQLADVAQAHQTQGLALQLRLGDAHLGLAVVLQIQVLDLFEVPGTVEHVEDGQFRHRDSVGSAGGTYQHSVLPGGRQVHPVITCPVAGQDLQLGGRVKDLPGNSSGSDNKCIAIPDIGDDVLLGKSSAVHRLIAMLPQIFIARRQNGLGDQHTGRHKHSSLSIDIYFSQKMLCSFRIHGNMD